MEWCDVSGQSGFGGHDMELLRFALRERLEPSLCRVCYESEWEEGESEKGRAAECGDVELMEKEADGDTCECLEVVRQAVRWEVCLRKLKHGCWFTDECWSGRPSSAQNMRRCRA